MSIETYGEQVSRFYDELYPPHTVPDVLSFIMDTVPPPADVMEFGVGTGRVAIPLARAGYRVHGIDVSPAMLLVLDEKDPERLVGITQGNFHDVPGGASFDLVLLLNSTLFMAPDLATRQRTFDAAAAQLKPGGRVVIETYSPAMFLGQAGIQHTFTPLGLGNRLVLDKTVVDIATQRLTIFRTFVTPSGISTMLEESWFAFPSELDLHARAAGLELDSRCDAWRKDATTVELTGMIASVYRKVGE